MSYDYAFRQFKHSITVESFGKLLITLAITEVIVNEQVANVQQPTGTQHPLHFPHQNLLIVIIGYAGKDGKEQHRIERIRLDGQK